MTGGLSLSPPVLTRRRLLGGTAAGLAGALLAPRLSPPAVGATPATSAPWQLRQNRGTIKGFAAQASAAPGDTVPLFVTTPAASFSLDVYRLGWYSDGTDQATLLQHRDALPGLRQPPPTTDATTGLISAAAWQSTAALSLGPWPTGLYLLKLTAADGDDTFLPLVVRDDSGSYDLLYVHSSNTDQAYNYWGGKSLYSGQSSGPFTVAGTAAAVKVSYDRPYARDGAGTTLTSWGLNWARWLDTCGLRVAYCADPDLHARLPLPGQAAAVIMGGHSEYWSREMRDHLEALRDRGTGLGFFTGDTGTWAVRCEDSPLGANRVLVCYKDATLDPLAASDPSRTTVRYWQAPLNRPLQPLLGVGSNGGVYQSADWTVQGAAAEPALFAGTGLQNGDTVTGLIGYEYDGLWTPGCGDSAPAGLSVLGQGRVIPANPSQLLGYAADHGFHTGQRPAVGSLAVPVETIDMGFNWLLYIHTSSSAGTVTLRYQPGKGSTNVVHDASGTTVALSAGAAFIAPGWQTLQRDLVADYTATLGPPPPDLAITGINVRGSIGVGPFAFTDSSGSVTTVPLAAGSPPEQSGWLASGNGQFAIDSSGPGGTPALVLTPSAPNGHRDDDSHTVLIRTTAGGRIFAAGTMQWVWSLDDYGSHMDVLGNRTPVDPRLQSLTRNLLTALTATPTPPAQVRGPVPESSIAPGSVTFQWSTSPSVAEYWLTIGTAGAGTSDVFHDNAGMTGSITVPNIPPGSGTVYVRLFSMIDRVWQHTDVTYSMSGASQAPVWLKPQPGSRLSSSSAIFQWSQGVGVTRYHLYLGTQGPGSANLYSSPAFPQDHITRVLVSNLPPAGATLYARLTWLRDSNWGSQAYTFEM